MTFPRTLPSAPADPPPGSAPGLDAPEGRSQAAKAFERALAPLREALQARAALPPVHPRAAWVGPDGRNILGTIEPALGLALEAAARDGGPRWSQRPPLGAGEHPPPPFDGLVAADAPVFQLQADAAGSLEASLAALARWLQARGLGQRWRDEALAVVDAEGRVHGAVERAMCRVLGITTFAVHLVGYTGRPAAGAPGGWIPVQWMQQRALDKATDPGLWDTLMGGQCPAHEPLETSLEREAWEEAGLRPADWQALHPAGHALMRRPVAEGYLIERVELFEAWLDPAVRPVNQDGEVAAFDTWTPDAAARAVAEGRCTLEAALMMARAIHPPRSEPRRSEPAAPFRSR